MEKEKEEKKGKMKLGDIIFRISFVLGMILIITYFSWNFYQKANTIAPKFPPPQQAEGEKAGKGE